MQVKIVMDSMLSDDASADTTALEGTLESFRALVSENTEGLAKYVKELQAIAAFQKAEADSLKEEAAKNLARVEKIMSNIGDCLNTMGMTEAQAGAYKFKFKAGSTVTQVDESILPKKYFVTKTIKETKPLPKPELKKLVESGLSIKGVTIVKNPPKLELK